jgi:hypothetical protein
LCDTARAGQHHPASTKTEHRFHRQTGSIDELA